MHREKEPGQDSERLPHVIEWRCPNAHLLAKIAIKGNQVMVSIKCHRCKHIAERAFDDIRAVKKAR